MWAIQHKCIGTLFLKDKWVMLSCRVRAAEIKGDRKFSMCFDHNPAIFFYFAIHDSEELT